MAAIPTLKRAIIAMIGIVCALLLTIFAITLVEPNDDPAIERPPTKIVRRGEGRHSAYSTERRESRSWPVESPPEEHDQSIEELTPILEPVDAMTQNRLEPWFEQYKSTIRVEYRVEYHKFVTFNDDLFVQIAYGNATEFRFRLDDEHDYHIVAESISRIGHGWILSGSVADRSDKSAARFFVLDDGSKLGDVRISGVVLLLIRPASQLPYHVVYSRTGAIPYD